MRPDQIEQLKQYQKELEEEEAMASDDKNVHPHGDHGCVCPQCGHEITAEADVKCNTQECPECGAPMVAKQAGERRTDELETVDIQDVEILAVGTWAGSPKEATYTEEDLDKIAEALNELIANKELNYEPPVKLGHDSEQKLLQADGYPSAGWIRSAKRVGDKLLGTFSEVPKKIAELIKAGAYKKRSAEVYENYEIGGKKYPLVLKAVSLLGADIPAVKTIDDIVALYGEGEPNCVTVLYEMGEEEPEPITLDDLMGELDAWATRAEGVIKRKPGSPTIRTYVKELKAKVSALSKGAGKPVSQNNKEEEHVMEQELRQVLGLAEDGDILETVRALVDKDKESATKLAEQTNLAEKVATLETTLAERDAADAVDKAIRAGKVSPAMKEWALDEAKDNPARFAKFVEAAPKIIDFKESGAEGGDEEAVELTELDNEVASAMGVSPEEMAEAKKEAK